MQVPVIIILPNFRNRFQYESNYVIIGYCCNV